jgi:hypothetical protein
MAYEFKKLSDVAAVEIPADTANVLIEEDGIIKKVAKKSVGETSEAILGKIATVDAVEEPSDTANVLIEESGAVKKVPVASVGSSIKTAIITDNWYDAAIAGATEPPAEDQVYRCSNMTYEEARAILVSGEPLDVFCKIMSDGPGPINCHAIVSYMPSNPFIVFMIIGFEIGFVLFWTADGISTEPPAGV